MGFWRGEGVFVLNAKEAIHGGDTCNVHTLDTTLSKGAFVVFFTLRNGTLISYH